jgi:hypothetical protein
LLAESELAWHQTPGLTDRAPIVPRTANRVPVGASQRGG